MLYLFQGLSNSIFGYELKWWNVTVLWFLVKMRSFVIHDSCQQRQWYLMSAATKCDLWLPVTVYLTLQAHLCMSSSHSAGRRCLVGVGRKPPKSSSMKLVMRCSLAICMFSYPYSIWKERDCFVKLWRIITFRLVPGYNEAIKRKRNHPQQNPQVLLTRLLTFFDKHWHLLLC